MTCTPDRMMRLSLVLAGLVASLVFPVLPALALQPPTAAEWSQLSSDPIEREQRVQKALSYGNHRVKPGVAASTAERLRVLAGGAPSQLPPPAWRGMPTTGTNNILVFLIDFPDQPHVNSYGLITNKLFGVGTPADFPTESLAKYYERSSYGLLNLKGSALGWYRMQHTRDWYTSTYGTGNAGNYAIIKEVTDHFDASIDYSQFDNNGDGKIDYFAVLWAGPDNGWANFWWGYQWELQQDLTRDGVQFFTFSWQWESNPSYPPYQTAFTPGVIIHETGHALGLPDYYDYDGSVGPDGGVGGMDMMDSGSGDHNCFSKFMLEWLPPTVITDSRDDFPLRHSADYPEAVALAKGYTGASAFSEYFMVQNRAKVNNDQKLPSAGLVVWHVDARLNGGGTDFLYNNSYTTHKLLRLMEGDGLEQIETGRSADSGDFYGPGKVFTPESTPNSLTYAGLSTEVRVTDISGPGLTMTADFSARDNSPVLNPSPIHVREGTVTNIEVSLWQAPTTNVTIAIQWLSGSSNLYLAGISNFSFTPLDYTVPQIMAVGAYSDADSNNDVAVFRIISSHASVQGTDFPVQQMDTGDSLPPGCAITAAANGERTQVTFTFAFDEDILGFDASDLTFTDNIAGGATLVGLEGSNRLYRAVFDCADTKGAIDLRVPAGSLTDQSGNFNPNPEYRAICTIPWVRGDFSDDFDGPVTPWTRSTNVFSGITMNGWQWGPPSFDAGRWSGPAAAYSGSKCWGTMAGPYDRSLDAWIQSPVMAVGAYPVVSFRLWLSGSGRGNLEANGGAGWYNVTPDNYFPSTSGAWVEQRVALDNTLFGSRTIRLRFRALDSAMYVDDVRVESHLGPAVWLASLTPDHGPAAATTPVSLSVYNATTVTLAGVVGDVTCADAGVTIGGGTVAYGTILPGAVAGGATDVSVTLAGTGTLGAATLRLRHQSRAGATSLAADVVPFTVDGFSPSPLTNLLTVSASGGVINWLGLPLQGNGGGSACIFQVLAAGSNRLPDAPTAAGQATGDDRVLYSSDTAEPWGRFGEGAGVAADLGRFIKSFVHDLTSNAVVYVRAWDAASYADAVAYGDSPVFALQTPAAQSRDLGSWRVDKPIVYDRDSNGDSVPDGWCVLHGLDPRQPFAALPVGVTEARAVTDCRFPNRVAVSTRFVFIADTENNRVQVWDRMLTNRMSVLGSVFAGEFSKPSGIAVSRDGRRLAVADTLNYRVRLFSVTPATGVLVPLLTFGSNGSGANQFNAPIAVAFGEAGDTLYVADSKASGLGNTRIQVFGTNGVWQATLGAAGAGDGEFGRILGLGMGTNGTLYAADSPLALADPDHGRVQAFAGGSAFSWAFGSNGSLAGQFDWIWDVQPGVGNLLYATDMNNRRIQVLNMNNAPSLAVVGAITNAGALGVLNLPRGAAPALDEGVLYVADTYNHRVLRLKVTLDADGDGMEDVWEVLHGLNPADPSDAGIDQDGDRITALGEYRIGTDPLDPNSSLGGPIMVPVQSLQMAPPMLNWLVESGYVYLVQWSTNLMGTNWTTAISVPSSMNGSMATSFAATNTTQFLRVWRTAP